MTEIHFMQITILGYITQTSTKKKTVKPLEIYKTSQFTKYIATWTRMSITILQNTFLFTEKD